MPGRPTVLTEARLNEDIEVLTQYVNEDGICIGILPTKILREHYGYAAPTPLYRDIKKLESLGRIAAYPPGATSYRYGFQITHKSTFETLEQRLSDVRQSIEKNIDELGSIITGLGRLATNQDARVD